MVSITYEGESRKPSWWDEIYEPLRPFAFSKLDSKAVEINGIEYHLVYHTADQIIEALQEAKNLGYQIVFRELFDPGKIPSSSLSEIHALYRFKKKGNKIWYHGLLSIIKRF